MTARRRRPLLQGGGAGEPGGAVGDREHQLHAGLELGDVVELSETYGIIDESWVTGFEHRWEPGQAATILNSAGTTNANSQIL